MIFLELHGNAKPKYELIPVLNTLGEALAETKHNLRRQGYRWRGNVWYNHPKKEWEGHITFFDRHCNTKTLEVTIL